MEYLVEHIADGSIQIIPDIEEVARIMQLDVAEIEWALEEHGRCDTDEYSVTEADAE